MSALWWCANGMRWWHTWPRWSSNPMINDFLHRPAFCFRRAPASANYNPSISIPKESMLAQRTVQKFHSPDKMSIKDFSGFTIHPQPVKKSKLYCNERKWIIIVWHILNLTTTHSYYYCQNWCLNSFLPGMQSICCSQLEEEPLESSLLEDSSQSHLQVFSAHVSLPSPS